MKEAYYSEQEWKLFMDHAKGKETPFLLVNLNIIRDKFQQMIDLFPHAMIYYAVKANPAVEVISLLKDLGSNFDIASIFELDKVLSLGVSPDRISYGNTIKKADHIKYFYDKGVRLFVTDSESDLRNIAFAAPGSKVFFRVLLENTSTADWGLSRKFGCQPDLVYDLAVLAQKLGLDPYGMSFHVGSQQREIGTWDGALAKVKYIFDLLKENEDIKLRMINMGGGFPANYVNKTNELTVYAEEILRYIEEDFGDDMPQIILEPGRSLVADAGILVSEVVLVSRKSRTALNRWVYTDVGKFSGLIETIEESIKFPIYTERTGVLEDVILAGPTCDSQDIMYENTMYPLPLSLATGDKLYWLTTGAYTTSYSAIEFNGFPPLKTYIFQ